MTEPLTQSDVANKPSTPLPWGTTHYDHCSLETEQHGFCHVPELIATFKNERDREYAQHAAHAYPRLIAAVKTLRVRGTVSMRDDADALLRELGEQS